MGDSYTPFEIAIFLKVENFSVREKYRIIDTIWDGREDLLVAHHFTEKGTFKKAVELELMKLDERAKDITEINMILTELGSQYRINNDMLGQDPIASYFKVIKLRLSFAPGRNYCRIKLRTIITSFGYKRRSFELVSTMNQVIKSLGLKTYLRGMVPCEIGTVPLDKVISIRLDRSSTGYGHPHNR